MTLRPPSVRELSRFTQSLSTTLRRLPYAPPTTLLLSQLRRSKLQEKNEDGGVKKRSSARER